MRLVVALVLAVSSLVAMGEPAHAGTVFVATAQGPAPGSCGPWGPCDVYAETNCVYGRFTTPGPDSEQRACRMRLTGFVDIAAGGIQCEGTGTGWISLLKADGTLLDRRGIVTLKVAGGTLTWLLVDNVIDGYDAYSSGTIAHVCVPPALFTPIMDGVFVSTSP